MLKVLSDKLKIVLNKINMLKILTAKIKSIFLKLFSLYSYICLNNFTNKDISIILFDFKRDLINLFCAY